MSQFMVLGAFVFVMSVAYSEVHSTFIAPIRDWATKSGVSDWVLLSGVVIAGILFGLYRLLNRKRTPKLQAIPSLPAIPAPMTPPSRPAAPGPMAISFDAKVPPDKAQRFFPYGIGRERIPPEFLDMVSKSDLVHYRIGN